MTETVLVVSGVHSDPDPSPGIGIARSLRDAFPQATLIAVDYSIRSSGLQHPVFDHVRLQPVWSEADLPTYASQIRQHLVQPFGCWISGLDVEVHWLASIIEDHPRLLLPSASAQQTIRKPELAVASSLGMHVPEFLPADSPPTALHRLGRDAGWQLWVKGKYHEAYFANSFPEVRLQIARLQTHWPSEHIFVQKHVAGLERAIAFAAYDGRLLEAVEVEKRTVTSQGKTWAARVTAAPADVKERLAAFVSAVRWTGGGEVEFLRDAAGTNWLIDFNPRFPAYIYGVTICGFNLPACLVSTALGRDVVSAPKQAQQFIRVVQELPVRMEFPLPRMIERRDGVASGGKHPSFQPMLVKKIEKAEIRVTALTSQKFEDVPAFLVGWQASRKTPCRLRDPAAIKAAVDRIGDGIAKGCTPRPRIVPALRIKTDPHPELARAFLYQGWLAEVISFRELEWARGIGFKDSQIVFNGPTATELACISGLRLAVIFADSVEAFEALSGSQQCDVLGLRLRASVISSRFGIDLTSFETFSRVARCLRRIGPDRALAIHVHFASDVCGLKRWTDLVDKAIVWAKALSDATRTKFSLFDVGGGWHSDDFDKTLLHELPGLQARISTTLPSVGTLILEPGKAVASDTAWLATRIVEVRSNGLNDDKEVVVDASISDLPMANLNAHRVLHLRQKRCCGWLTGGVQRVLGASCMEADILTEGVAFPERPVAGDLLLFSSAGGYNASMAWHFAAGVSRDS
jgi:diaminopimelate decarboxylase